ncbi:hypothetical protein KNO15_17845 [Leifsonia shinshuensis]|uniref:hypothetical protein n=1 Tax=Leifsonia shinshuensis TaxID=150026 RepID=UPI001F5044D1|nr:hypothetical protein [Leifsonia shinshuensis]MCI0158568.1 hypothetical protein [Leifsonia shinshuensis]
MMLPPTPRVLALREIVGDVRALAPRGRVIVAVDGGGGTAAFADDLAEVFREAGSDTHRASVGDFHRPRADRTLLGPETPTGFYRDSFDYGTLRRVLIDPFRMAGSTGFQTAAFDEARDVPVESRWETAGPDAVLVIDGEFLLRPELRREWNASVLLVNAPERAIYEEEARPREVATILVDDSDPVAPVRVARPESA